MRQLICDAWLEFYTGEMPESPDSPITTQKLLARLWVIPGTLQVEPDEAIASGTVAWARLIGADGEAVIDFLVSRKDGPGWLTFNTLEFRKGGPVSFFGRMAIFSQKPLSDEDVTAGIHGRDAAGKRIRELHRKWHQSEIERRRNTGQPY